MNYLVKAEETNLYKIGYTAGTTESRVKAMQTGCPHKLSIIKEVHGSQEREKWLHEAFSENRRQGEWFEFDEETLEKVYDMMVAKRPKHNEITTEEWRDMYERFIREKDSCDFSMDSFIYLAILEIMLGNNDIAIQRLREFQTLLFGGTHHNCIPPLNEKILHTE